MTTIKALRVTMPSQRLTDPSFRYVPACATDLAETFRRARFDRHSLTLEQCVEHAWNEIKDRKGYLNEQGVFVKEQV